MLINTLPSTYGTLQPRDWLNGDKFLQFVDLSIYYAKPTINCKIILFLGSLNSHITIPAISKYVERMLLWC
jgi:hypothetical protein